MSSINILQQLGVFVLAVLFSISCVLANNRKAKIKKTKLNKTEGEGN